MARTHGGPRLYRRLTSEARPYRRHIAGLFALSLLSSALALLTPLPLAIAIDSVVGSHALPGFVAVFVPAAAEDSQTGVLLVAVGLVVLLALLKQLQQFGNLVLATYTGEKLLLQVRTRLFRHAERLSLAYHDARGTADSAYRIQYDATAIQNIVVTGLIPFFTAAVTVGGMIYITARIDWQLAVVALTVAPILFVVTRVYRKRLRAQWHDAKKLESSALSVVHESLEALRVVKAFGREDHARDRFAHRSSASVRARIQLAFIEGRFGSVIGVTIGLGMATVLWLGTRRVLAGAMTVGDLVLVMAYLQQLYDPLKTASRKVGALQSSLASAERVYSLLDEAPDFVDPPHVRPLARARGAVAFQNVSFAYPDGRLVLDDVSFDVAPGTRLGIAGATGAGKTTLISLLTRFYDPTSGRIFLDDVILPRYKLADLRNQFAIVLQEPVLFSTSIGENIAYARPSADHVDVVAAAKAAGAHDFIRSLPDGYETPVGERGVRLSGGERQRIALARAFLKEAPILVLDEPTSSVDPRTEVEILDAMERLMSGRTVFMIAHREGTLEICDARLELEHGRALNAPAPDPRPSHRPRRPVAAPEQRPSPPIRGLGKNGSVPCDAAGQRVVAAWQTIAPSGSRIVRVDCLPVRKRDKVYRLQLANGSCGVIAKRAPSNTLLVEQKIYEQILPQLPAPALRYFGLVRDSDASYSWLFVEDAGDVPCSLGEHGPLAARWLGTLHGAAAELDIAPSLPERGPRHYLEHLRSARTRIADGLGHAALATGDTDMLREILAAYELIESEWRGVERFCADLPRTLVHGDLAPKNLRLRHADAVPSIVAFDWEMSGFGVPAADVYQLAADANREDLSRYRSTISEYVPGIDDDQLRALVFAGNGFRLLACTDWASTWLPFPTPEKGVAALRVYEPCLRAWAAALPNAR